MVYLTVLVQSAALRRLAVVIRLVESEMAVESILYEGHICHVECGVLFWLVGLSVVCDTIDVMLFVVEAFL